MKEVFVLSLGGSLIVPEKVDPSWIEKFRSKILRLSQKNKFVIVCGGGFVAREYITILEKEHKSKKEQSLAGINVTRMNAKILMQIFGAHANKSLPLDMKEVKELLEKKDIVFCGALRYAPNQTSDSTAANIAKFLKAKFVNMTNVSGLYSQNPNKYKNAKFIPSISWRDFEKRALKLKYKPGQHFVLDQKASTIIRKNKITTYIIGKDIKSLENIVKNKKFKGTIIEG